MAEHQRKHTHCTIEGCARDHYARGLCRRHYQRQDTKLPVMELHPKYTKEQADLALTELALAGGSFAKASRRCKEQGQDIPVSAIQSFSASYAERYAEIAHEVLPKLEQRFVAKIAERFAQADDVEEEAWRQQMEQLRDGDAKNLATIAKQAAISKGISLDKLSDLTGRPQRPQQQADMEQIWSELKRVAPNLFADSTATEEKIEDAEIVDEETPALAA